MNMATDWSTAMKMLYSQEIWRMAIHWPLSLIYSYFCLLSSHLFPFFLRSSPSSSYPRCRLSLDPESEIKQPICIVTGATSGLGAAAAQALATEAYHVVLVGRSSQLLDQTIQEIKQKHKDAKLKAFQDDADKLHRCVFSHKTAFATTQEQPCSFSDSQCDIFYPSICFADPGAVETRIMRELPQCFSQLAFTILRCLFLLQSPEDGVCSIVDAALAPLEVSGKYFFGGKGRTIPSSSISYNAKLGRDLWSASNALFQEYLQIKG